MGLDHSRGCVNFRDVGECLNLLAGDVLLPPGRLLRGGKLEIVRAAAEIGSPGTIVNLRNGPDPADKRFGAEYRHFPTSNDLDKYRTAESSVRRWLTSVVAFTAAEAARVPILFHCTSGKDRTGVVVAALLSILGIPRALIVEEYLWSRGEVRRSWIEEALDGIGEPTEYFRRINLEMLRRKLGPE